ncbi:MAG: Bax inhibitor-1 family protein [Planctomycetaceae bacterium]|jgi:FtsH-binding integral membrane protein|nr:Bax inhibitor-1 family protein [Planctomycetaceae bacterium]
MQNQYNQFDDNFNAPTDLFAAAANEEMRAAFITKTYLYLLGAIAALTVIEFGILSVPGLGEKLTSVMLAGQFSWLIVLGLFMFVSWIANSWALNAASPAMQHAGLGIYVVAQALILAPLLCIAQHTGGQGTIAAAAGATAALFALLTVTVFVTRKDFSFLRSFLMFGGFAALGFVVFAVIFGITIGPLFMYLMIAFACCYILYDTSNVLHHYRIGQHCAAALALFASVVLLFWYILQLFMSSRE